MKCHVDEIASWWNVKLGKLTIDEITKWINWQIDEIDNGWNGNLTKLQVDEITKWMKRQIDLIDSLWIASWWYFKLIKRHVDNFKLMKWQIE